MERWRGFAARMAFGYGELRTALTVETHSASVSVLNDRLPLAMV